MIQGISEIIKQGKFKVDYSSARKYLYDEGNIILTPNKLLLICGEKWKRIFDYDDIDLGVWEGCLEIIDFYHGKIWFKLKIDEPAVWRESFDKIRDEKISQMWDELYFGGEKRSKEMKRLFDISQEAIMKLYNETRKEREQFLRKNIHFNLGIQGSYLKRSVKDRKLKAFIIAHSYVAWYEWTKKLLRKVFKAKKGKGLKDDEELLNFLDGYPFLRKALDTTKWGLRANQIRNCVSHEKFYFDYKKMK